MTVIEFSDVNGVVIPKVVTHSNVEHLYQKGISIMGKIKKQIDFTEGKLFGKILLFILPILVTNLLQTLYHTADMMVVSFSHDGQNAVGAIGTTGSFISVVNQIFIGFSVGVNIVVARAVGAKDIERVQKAVHTSILMAIIFGVTCLGVGLAITKSVLRAMGGYGNLLNLAVRYAYVYFLGIPFMALTNYLMGIFRAKGDSKTPLIVLMLTGLLNIVLNVLFVLVFKMSVEGVAIATVLSNGCSAVILLVKLRRAEDDTAFSWGKLSLDKMSFREILFNGIPAAIQGTLSSLSNLLISASIVRINNTLCPSETVSPIVNGNSAANNLIGFLNMAVSAVYQGTLTFVSQNMGAKKIHRIRKIMYTCTMITVVTCGTLCGLVYLLRVPILSLYGISAGEAGSVEQFAMYAAETNLKYNCFTYILCGIMHVGSGVLKGLGRPLTAMSILVGGSYLLRLLWIVFLFPLKPTLDMIFISYPIGWTITCIVSYIVSFVLLNRQSKIQGGNNEIRNN